MDKPLVSVIIPVYNVEKYLDRCLESVVNQTYANLEIIVVDDGSIDCSAVICDNWKEKDSRIIVIHKRNEGVSAARNDALDIAKGEYICCIDSDDFAETTMIDALYNQLVQDESDIAICNYKMIDDSDTVYEDNDFSFPKSILNNEDSVKCFSSDKHWHYTAVWGKLYKRFLFDDIRFPIGKIHEDVFTLLKIFSKCNCISCLNDCLYYYYQNDQSLTHNITEENLDVLDAYILRYHFFYERNDYYSALKTLVGFADNYLKLYHVFSDDTKVLKKLSAYQTIYRSLYRKIMLKKIKKTKKYKAFSFCFGAKAYEKYNLFASRI